MRESGPILTVVSVTMVCGLFLSCGNEDILGPGDQSNDRIAITNDEGRLEDRVQYYTEQEVTVDSAGTRPLAKRVASQDFSLKLVAEVTPPSIDGQVLQATSVVIKGNRAIISYNMRGEPYLGAIDVFNISKKKTPKLTSEALFNDTDIHSVSFDAGNVYAATATGDPAFSNPAVLEVIRLTGDKLILEGNERIPLASFAGTCIEATEDVIYATSGDDGGLGTFDPSSLDPISAIPLHDARWVDVEDDKVVVVQGTPGQLSVFDENDLTPLGTYSFNGADVAESKSTVEILGGKAFVAGGSGGVQILSVVTGSVVGNIPRPDPDALGLDESVVVTNAVSVDDDLLFISNGEAGVYVAQGSEEFDKTGSEEQQEITVLGKLRFDDLQSVNHVTYKGKYLIVAGGLGGLKIVEIEDD
ncbi:MAG: hypothetical protein ACE5HZ_06650 [Fidelibacterota bacterium]